MTMIVNIVGDVDADAYQDTIGSIRDRAGDLPTGAGVSVSRPGGLVTDLIDIFVRINSLLIYVTIGLIMVVLIVIYRSPVSAGVLIDTFISRSIVVPSVVVLLGRHNWWPGGGPDGVCGGKSVDRSAQARPRLPERIRRRIRRTVLIPCLRITTAANAKSRPHMRSALEVRATRGCQCQSRCWI